MRRAQSSNVVLRWTRGYSPAKAQRNTGDARPQLGEVKLRAAVLALE